MLSRQLPGNVFWVSFRTNGFYLLFAIDRTTRHALVSLRLVLDALSPLAFWSTTQMVQPSNSDLLRNREPARQKFKPISIRRTYSCRQPSRQMNARFTLLLNSKAPPALTSPAGGDFDLKLRYVLEYWLDGTINNSLRPRDFGVTP